MNQQEIRGKIVPVSESLNPFVDEIVSRCSSPIEYLHYLEPIIPNALLSEENYQKIESIASTFTRNVTSFLIFESRVSSEEAQPDFCFAVSSKGGEKENLLEDLSMMYQVEWNHLYEFTKEWVTPENPISEHVQGLWFEFDTARDADRLIPSVFVHCSPIYADSDCSWVIDHALPVLRGKPVSERTQKNIERCIRNLPSTASVFQIGTMLSRGQDEVRIVIKGLRAHEIIPYLRKIGNASSSERLKAIVEEQMRFCNRCVLQIGIEDDILPTVGFEVSFKPDRFHKEMGWKEVFDVLVRKGYCLAEKRDAVLDFVREECMDGECDSGIHEDLSDSTCMSCYISHVKFVVHPVRETQVKAYSAARVMKRRVKRDI